MEQKLGARLRELRLAKAWSLRDAATETKLSNGYLYLLETGKVKNPRPNILLKLAEAYGIPYEAVMGWAGYLNESRISDRTGSYGVALSSTLTKTINQLSEAQKAKVAEYISFIKKQKRTD